MIIDKISNWECYHFGNAWQMAFQFLSTLTPDSENKKYHIQNEDIFAIVASYDTRSPETALYETHEKFADIQAVLSGRERIEWLPREGLVTEIAYDESKDIEFYRADFPGASHIDLFPGTFVMMLPQDAHMPSLMLETRPESVKKVVVKISVALL